MTGGHEVFWAVPLGTSVVIGLLARLVKRRSGVVWSLLTLLAIGATWVFLAGMMPLRGTCTDRWPEALVLMACGVSGVYMGLIVVALPRHRYRRWVMG